MQRSRSQVLYRYLPEAVFSHDDDVIVQTNRVLGTELVTGINRDVLLAEVDAAMKQWPDERRAGIPLPSRVSAREFIVLEPSQLEWDVWPLVYQCDSRRHCGRIRRFFKLRDVRRALDASGRLTCLSCSARMRQMRYVSAHECGKLSQLFVPQCSSCRRQDDIVFEDTGSFETSAWRCRACGGRYVRGMRFTPCTCGQYVPEGRTSSQAFMRAFTVRDPRVFFPQSVYLLNLRTRVYDRLQAHPERARVTVASYLGDVRDVGQALDEVDQAGNQVQRFSQVEWEERVRTIYCQLDAEEIEDIRRRRGPLDEGVGTVSALSSEVATLGRSRQLLERAVLFDLQQFTRRTLRESEAEAVGDARLDAAGRLSRARRLATGLGIAEIAVTMEFPIAVAAYGYTRVHRKPGEATLQGFARQNEYEGRSPIFAVTTDTEAVLVTLSASRVIKWLISRGHMKGVHPVDERAARAMVLDIFADPDRYSDAVRNATTLVHTLSHVMLRALSGGHSGFGEASLAEWLCPETLTFAIYVSSFQSYTLGALWTVLHTRALEWLSRSENAVWRCDHDPICHHREPRACERCLFLTFGCPGFNADLSRAVATDFWRVPRPSSASTVLS